MLRSIFLVVKEEFHTVRDLHELRTLNFALRIRMSKSPQVNSVYTIKRAIWLRKAEYTWRPDLQLMAYAIHIRPLSFLQPVS